VPFDGLLCTSSSATMHPEATGMRARTLFEIIAGDEGPAAPPGGDHAWRERLSIALDTLSPRQALVVRERYLGESRPTLAEVAAALEVSRSRIWALEREALKKLRHPSRRQYLLGQGELLAAPWSPYRERRLSAFTLPVVLHAGLDLRRRLLIDLRELDLSVRAAHRLEEAGVRYVGDVVRKRETDLLRIPYFGRKTLREIKGVLQGLGLSLGMEVDGWARMKAEATWWPKGEGPGQPAAAPAASGEGGSHDGHAPDGDEDGR